MACISFSSRNRRPREEVIHTERNRPSRAVPARARLDAFAAVGAQGSAGEQKSLGDRGAYCGGGAQREPGLELFSRASMTPPPVSADVGRQRGGRKDRGGRFRACACRGHRGKRDAVGEESWVVSCCCGVCKCPITKGSFWCENEHPNGDHSCYLTGCAEISHRRNKHVRVESCLLYTSPSPRDKRQSRMPSSA